MAITKNEILLLLLFFIFLFIVNLAHAQDTPGLQIEYEKLRMEKLKAWLTGLSIFIPALIAIISISWQMKNASKLKQSDTKTAFQLKAAEIVLNSASPAAARNRAEVLRQLFPEYLPSDFAKSFDSTILPGTRKQDKLEFLKLISQYPSLKKEIIKTWKKLFPWDDEWLNGDVENS